MPEPGGRNPNFPGRPDTDAGRFPGHMVSSWFTDQGACTRRSLRSMRLSGKHAGARQLYASNGINQAECVKESYLTLNSQATTEYSFSGDVVTSTVSRRRSLIPETLKALSSRANSRLAKTAGFIVAGSVLLFASLLLTIPRAEISPEAGKAFVRSDGQIHVQVPRFSSISKIAVFINSEQKWLEYNIENSDYTAPVQLDPGSAVTVEIKVTSSLGIVRDFSSNFTTVEPVRVTSATSGGGVINSDTMLAPQAPMAFSFDKSVDSAWVSLDNAIPIPLELDDSGLIGKLVPNFTLKQGAAHELAVWANGVDGSAISEGNRFPFKVVQPLTLVADSSSAFSDESSVRLAASVPFNDPDLVRQSIQVSLPDTCSVSVDKTGISLNFHGPVVRELTVTIANAFGQDGSYLELPAAFHFMGAGSTNINTSENSIVSTTSRGVTTNNANSPGVEIANAGVISGDSDVPPPPPGWPPCCPWPPR